MSYKVILKSTKNLVKLLNKSILKIRQFGHSTANLGKVKIIPTGTYDLLQLTDLGDRLCRRTKIVHFSRYRASVEDEREKFKSIVKALEIERNRSNRSVSRKQ